MFIMWIKKEKELSFTKRIVLPIIATAVCCFMIFAAVYAHGITPYLTAKGTGNFSFPVLFYLIIFSVIMIVGTFFSPAYKEKHKNK